MLKNAHHQFDPVWHVQISVLLAIFLQLVLPDIYVTGTRYVLVAVSLVLLLALSATTPRKPTFESRFRRANVIGLVAVIAFTNIYSLARLTDTLLRGGSVIDGRKLIISGINIYITNIIVFALLYWEMDGGGPGARIKAKLHQTDFLFPQDNDPDTKWRPTFLDYVYVSSTNATAFSPTDTLPLSRRAKMLMLAQSFIALITIALIAGRAVNILK